MFSPRYHTAHDKILANSKVFGKHHSPVRSTSATLLTPSFLTNFTNSAQTGDLHCTVQGVSKKELSEIKKLSEKD